MNAKSQFSIVRAYDGFPMQDVAKVDAAGAEAMLARAEALHRGRGGALPAWRRIEILRKLMTLMEAEVEALALLIAHEGGKPLTDARVEVSRAINGVDLAIAELGQHAGVEIPMDTTQAAAGRLAFTTKEPIGVVVAVSAFNHPLNLIIHQVVPAVAVGCPVIVKPAPPTPLSCIRFVELLHQAGLPEGWCQVCPCDNDVAEQLVSDARVAFFSFIGSARIGWYLRSKLAPGARCALEHGGAAPVIVAADADFATMLPLLVKGGYYHAGQVCVSVQRIFVDNKVKANFVDALAPQISALVVGDPADAATEVGPLIRPGEVDRVEAWVDEAIADGAICPVGGARISDRVYEPTVLVDPPAGATVSTTEIFGPVTCVYGYDHIDDAIAQANALPVAFQAAVFSRDIERIFHAARHLDASAVMINDHTAFRVDWMPFAGRRTSGLGVGGIGHTMADMSQDKMIVIKA
ncbi:MAG: aldehyde dehydrogenase family protein [Alphaproteobacteria bacterium]|nr:aldehyde dehydrogenase family protein [Alphaproteobacteria bacterium]